VILEGANIQATPCAEELGAQGLFIDDVTLNRDDAETGQVRFKGGSTTSVAVALHAPEASGRQPPSSLPR
jgi:hypothetical protein